MVHGLQSYMYGPACPLTFLCSFRSFSPVFFSSGLLFFRFLRFVQRAHLKVCLLPDNTYGKKPFSGGMLCHECEESWCTATEHAHHTCPAIDRNNDEIIAKRGFFAGFINVLAADLIQRRLKLEVYVHPVKTDFKVTMNKVRGVSFDEEDFEKTFKTLASELGGMCDKVKVDVTDGKNVLTAFKRNCERLAYDLSPPKLLGSGAKPRIAVEWLSVQQLQDACELPGMACNNWVSGASTADKNKWKTHTRTLLVDFLKNTPTTPASRALEGQALQAFVLREAGVLLEPSLRHFSAVETAWTNVQASRSADRTSFHQEIFLCSYFMLAFGTGTMALVRHCTQTGSLEQPSGWCSTGRRCARACNSSEIQGNLTCSTSRARTCVRSSVLTSTRFYCRCCSVWRPWPGFLRATTKS